MAGSMTTSSRGLNTVYVPGRPVGKRPLLLLLSVLILATCYGAPGAEPVSVDPVPSVSDPAPSVSDPADARPAGETQGPITYLPDNMWVFLASMGEGMRRADTLSEAVDFAELIVIGRYVGVERGARYGSDSTAVALINVDSVIKGTPNLGPDGLLRVEFVLVVGPGGYPDKEFADLERSIPKDPALLYLFSWASFAKVWDAVPSWSTRTDLADRYKTIGNDGAMRIENGKIAAAYVDGWPTELQGLGIEQVTDQIRAAISLDAPPGAPAP